MRGMTSVTGSMGHGLGMAQTTVEDRAVICPVAHARPCAHESGAAITLSGTLSHRQGRATALLKLVRTPGLEYAGASI